MRAPRYEVGEQLRLHRARQAETAVAFQSVLGWQAQFRDPFREFIRSQRLIQERLGMIPRLDKTFQVLQSPFLRDEALLAIRDTARAVSASLSAIQFTCSSLSWVAETARMEKNVRALSAAGWLPHYTTPWGDVEENVADAEAVRLVMGQFYQDHWTEVRAEVERRLVSYGVDDEAKQAFGEALDSHEAGRYRSVCALLLHEIERVVRVEFYDGNLEGISSQKRLIELAGDLCPSELEPCGLYGLELYRRLAEHIYERCTDEAARSRFSADPVPNRHAVVHGLVTYNSQQSSLNTVFMADYIFQIVRAVKIRNAEIAILADRSQASPARPPSVVLADRTQRTV